jgi:uncharacterized protein (DUF1810 family)
MTLFGAVSDNPLFTGAIARYLGGTRDQATLDILGQFDGKPR